MPQNHPVPYEPGNASVEPRPKREVVISKDESLDDLRARLEARETGIRDHLAGLKAELTTLDDFAVGGRPLLDHVRADPMRAVAYSAAGGAVVGVLAGLVSRWRREEASDEEQTLRLFTTAMMDDAAEFAAHGDDLKQALRKAARRHAPTIYLAAPGSAGTQARGAIREGFDLALKSAMGFGVKMAMDMLSKRLTGTPEVFTATQEASDNASA